MHEGVILIGVAIWMHAYLWKYYGLDNFICEQILGNKMNARWILSANYYHVRPIITQLFYGCRMNPIHAIILIG
jgi:hypothetical protein